MAGLQWLRRGGRADVMGDLTDLFAHSSNEIGGLFKKVNDISLTVLSEEAETVEQLRSKLRAAEEKSREEGETKALMRAARALRRGDSTLVVALVVAKRICVNTPLPPSKSTLLHVAAALGDLETCQLLARHGARPSLNAAGQTPSVVSLLSQGHGEAHFFLRGLESSAPSSPSQHWGGSAWSPEQSSWRRSSGPMSAIELGPSWASAAATEEAHRVFPSEGIQRSEGGDEPEEEGPHRDLVETVLGAIALFQFTPTISGPPFPPDPRIELDLEAGERVVVQAFGKGGTPLAEWAVVMRESTGEDGFVPVSYLEFDEECDDDSWNDAASTCV